MLAPGLASQPADGHTSHFLLAGIRECLHELGMFLVQVHAFTRDLQFFNRLGNLGAEFTALD